MTARKRTGFWLDQLRYLKAAGMTSKKRKQYSIVRPPNHLNIEIPMISIEPATTADSIVQARTLFEEYQTALGVDLGFQDFENELATLPGQYAAPDGRLLLANIGGSVAGCVALRPLSGGDACEMKRLFVRPAFRASGVGRMLAERVIAEARSIGYRRMCLDTLPSMGRAQQLYDALGFREVAPYRYNPVAGTRYLSLDL
jgi:putative acetyltransferase